MQLSTVADLHFKKGLKLWEAWINDLSVADGDTITQHNLNAMYDSDTVHFGWQLVKCSM